MRPGRVNSSNNARPRRPRGRPARGAFTMVELVVSIFAMAVLLGGMASAVVLVTRALPADRTELDAVVDGSAVLEQITTELTCANRISIAGDHAISFFVADRDGDSQDEEIRYQWSGTAGHPLYRKYNANTRATLVPAVSDFTLTYVMRTLITDGDPVQEESAETVLASADTDQRLDDKKIEEDKWIGHYFHPTLPNNAVGWRVTRVFFVARQDGPDDGTFAVQLRPASADYNPTDEILASVSMRESDLGSNYGWEQADFGDTVDMVRPDQGLCIVVQYLSKKPSCRILYSKENDNPGATVSNARLETSNAGASWTVKENETLLYYAYGTVTTEGDPEQIETNFTQRVRLSLTVGSEPHRRVETSVGLLNVPEVDG
jgi:hypothetical protein